MFNLSYDNETGAVVNYNEGEPESLHTPDGCIPLSFKDHIPGFFHTNGQILMKVDIKTGKLVRLNPIEIPDPVANPANSAK